MLKWKPHFAYLWGRDAWPYSVSGQGSANHVYERWEVLLTTPPKILTALQVLCQHQSLPESCVLSLVVLSTHGSRGTKNLPKAPGK